MNELTGNPKPDPTAEPSATPVSIAVEMAQSSGVAVATSASVETKGLSFDGWARQIKARQNPDKSALHAFHHPCFDAPFFISQMAFPGYLAVENVAVYGPPGTTSAGQKISSKKQDEQNQTLAYIMHAVWLETADGLKHPTREMALELFDMEGAGPGNRALINAIKALNPPREYLNQQLATIWAGSSGLTLALRIMLNLGLGKVLLDYLAPSATPEEKEAAAVAIQKVEEVALELGPLFGNDELAQRMGIRLDQTFGQTQAPGGA